MYWEVGDERWRRLFFCVSVTVGGGGVSVDVDDVDDVVGVGWEMTEVFRSGFDADIDAIALDMTLSD